MKSDIERLNNDLAVYAKNDKTNNKPKLNDD